MATEDPGSDDLTISSQTGMVVDTITLSDGVQNIGDQGIISVTVDASSLHGIPGLTAHAGIDAADSDEHDPRDEEPPSKRQKTDGIALASSNVNVNSNINHDQSIKQLLFTINKAICMRLDGIENSIEILNGRTKYLEEKVEELVQTNKQSNSVLPNNTLVSPNNNRKGAVIVGLPQGTTKVENTGPGVNNGDGIQNMGLGPNVTLITLNSEEDYPQGTWLGDENNPEMRVRVPITPSDLLHIHSNCRTAEKMALTMLDYLFDRETQASSNLSGMGKHGKRQLDPLMIYGIRCHLIHRFGINEADWHRIKQNVDSKCRTAFRRKQKGMPLTVKAFRGKSTPTYIQVGPDEMGSDDDSLQDAELHIHQGQLDLKQTMAAMQTEGLPPGEIQILHATPEQISQLQQAHHIQILQGDQVIQVPMPMTQSEDTNDLQVAVSLPQTDSVRVVTTEDGEVVQLAQVDPGVADQSS
ncbi:protein BANP-like [Argopecten irradians]|uniref:protein BANP-like n=1 Tax=Argopecten irradians TaxID=31199 RepID=UPI0037105A32